MPWLFLSHWLHLLRGHLLPTASVQRCSSAAKVPIKRSSRSFTQDIVQVRKLGRKKLGRLVAAGTGISGSNPPQPQKAVC
jgi:hypothetical protein